MDKTMNNLNKELVTREMFLEAMNAGDVGYCEGECHIDVMVAHLNTALAPLLAKHDAAVRLDEAKWWNENSGFYGLNVLLKQERLAALETGRQE